MWNRNAALVDAPRPRVGYRSQFFPPRNANKPAHPAATTRPLLTSTKQTRKTMNSGLLSL